MKPNKPSSLFLVALAILVGASCASQSTLQVTVPVNAPDAIKFLDYDKVFYGGINIQAEVEPIEPGKNLADFFTDEFSQIVGREITPLPLDPEAAKTGRSIEERVSHIPNSLLIKGEFSIDIKSQNIVKDEKGRSKKKVRVLSKVELWEMKLSVSFIETETGKPVAVHSMTTRMKDADPEKRSYNFKSLFDDITDQFVRKATRKVRMEKRTLLLK